MFSIDSPYLRPVVVPPGEYQMNTIPNPHHADGQPWIIIEGTTIGLNRAFARDMSRIHFADFEIDEQQNEPLSLMAMPNQS